MNASTSRQIGAISVVAGTAIGAGMLGLPMVIGKLGFTTAIGVMVAVWLLAVYSAFLLLEVNLKVGPGENFNNMAKKVLGPGGQIVATGSMMFLQYALLVAYLTGVGELIARTAASVDLALTPQAGAIYFSIFGAFIVFLGTNIIVRVNQFLFFVMIAAMLTALFSLAPQVEVQNLTGGNPDSALIFASIPVLFTSFGFHTGIPSVIRYLDVPVRKLRLVTFVGSSLPFVCYLFWVYVSIGGTSPEKMVAMQNVDMLVHTLSNGSSWLNTVVSSFASLALLTSFLGVSLALFDLQAEVFKLSDSFKHRALTTLIVFVPPLVASSLCPGRFIQALAHAGAALAILAIFLPCLMVWKLRRAKVKRPVDYQVPGGTPALIAAFVFGLVIVSASYI